MGFDNECILNIQSLPGEYFCPFCRTLIYPNEALQTQCTHLYCKPCLAYIVATTHSCPYDGYLVTEADAKPLIESNKSVAEAIGKVGVYCLYHRSGCQWQGTLTECIAHCTECDFGNSPVVCNRCGTQIMHRQVQEHAQSCPGLQPQAQPIDNSQTQAVTQDSSTESSTATATISTSTAAISAPIATITTATSTAIATVPITAATTTLTSATTSTTAAPAFAQFASSQGQIQANAIAHQQAAPAPEQWYQQQQLQYQQYYQHYPGYDYQQQYQQYGQYQQQVYQQHPQPYMQVPAQQVAQGQQQPPQPMNQQTQLQPQPQPQQQIQPPPQLHPQPHIRALQPQAHPQYQAQAQQQSFTNLQPQHHPHPQPQYPPPAQHPQMQAQQPLQHTQQQTHPPPYAQVPGQAHPQPHPQIQSLHPQQQQIMPPQNNPYPPVQQIQPLPQTHAQAQPPLRARMQLPPYPRPQGQPFAQPQLQHPPAQAVSGHQSYPQTHPFQQAPSGNQRPITVHSPQQTLPYPPAQLPGQLQSQFPQQAAQMRPPPNSMPMQAQQHPGMLPPQGPLADVVPTHQHPPHSGQQLGHQVHHQVGLQPPAQQHLLHHQGQMYQHLLHPQQTLRPQGPPMQQHMFVQSKLQQNVPVAHGLPPQQSLNHETPQQTALRSTSSEQQGNSAPDKVVQVPKLEGDAAPKSAEGAADLKIPKKEIDSTCIVDNGKGSKEVQENDKADTDGKPFQESARVAGETQDDKLDERVIWNATKEEATDSQDGDKEVEQRNTKVELQGRDVEKSEGSRTVQQPLPELGSHGINPSEMTVHSSVPDELRGMPPAGPFPGQAQDVYSQQVAYGHSPNIGDLTKASQRPPAPDRLFPPNMLHPVLIQERRFQEPPPHHMQLQSQHFGPGPVRPPGHSFSEHIPHQGQPLSSSEPFRPPQGRQPYDSYHFEARHPQDDPWTGPPMNGAPPAMFDPPGGMMAMGLSGPLDQVGQSRIPDRMNGIPRKGPVASTHDPAIARGFGQESFRPLPEERFKHFHEEGFKVAREERFTPSALDPHRHIASQREFEEDLKQFAGPTYLDGEGVHKFEYHGSSSGLLERGSRHFGLKSALGSFDKASHWSDGGNSNLSPRSLPHYQIGSFSMERSKTGLRDDLRRRPDVIGSDSAIGPPHRVDGPVLSPGRAYGGLPSGKFAFGSQPSRDDFGGREPRGSGERLKGFGIPLDSFGSSFPENRFPRPYGPGDIRNDLDGPDTFPNHLHGVRGSGAFGARTMSGNFRGVESLGHGQLRFGETGGFSGHRRDSQMLVSAVPPKPGTDGSYPRHSFSNETRHFGPVSTFGDMEYELPQKRGPGSISWCRICKVDCATVEGLEIHSQTRDHQKMTMDIVLRIKQENSKKIKPVDGDNEVVEDTNKSANESPEVH